MTSSTHQRTICAVVRGTTENRPPVTECPTGRDGLADQLMCEGMNGTSAANEHQASRRGVVFRATGREALMIFASQFVTLDGIASDPELWHAEYASEQSNDLLRAELDSADAHLLGRRTFEELDEFWPAVDPAVPIAVETNRLDKLVVSSAPDGARWGARTGNGLFEYGSTEWVQSLDAIPRDARLMLSGSLSLQRSLLDARLLDELHLYIDPIVRGTGRPLFSAGSSTRLRSIRRVELPHGILYAEYSIER